MKIIVEVLKVLILTSTIKCLHIMVIRVDSLVEEICKMSFTALLLFQVLFAALSTRDIV